MTWLHALILSIIEGATEFLPISSTGHLILATKLLGIELTEFTKSFDIIIQSGAIAAIVVLYWKSFLDVTLVKRLFVAFLPSALFGFLLYPFVKGFLLGSATVTVMSLFIGGIFLIGFERLVRSDRGRQQQDLGLGQLLLIGLFQSLAMIPGVSRSGATIVGGMLVGLPRREAVEFSFLLAVPTMIAATGLDLVKTGMSFSPDEVNLLAVGFLGSFVVALLVIKWFLQFVRRSTMVPFGIYRIIIAMLYLFFLT